ncbi:MAG: hypothetical protein ACE5NJ_12630, partial [Thermodesulfobacteriota bacterium]
NDEGARREFEASRILHRHLTTSLMKWVRNGLSGRRGLKRTRGADTSGMFTREYKTKQKGKMSKS